MVNVVMERRCADRFGRGWTRAWVSVCLLRMGTKQNPSLATAMPEYEAALAALAMAQEPSSPMKKQVSLVTTPGAMQVPSASRMEQKLLPALVRTLP